MTWLGEVGGWRARAGHQAPCNSKHRLAGAPKCHTWLFCSYCKPETASACTYTTVVRQHIAYIFMCNIVYIYIFLHLLLMTVILTLTVKHCPNRAPTCHIKPYPSRANASWSVSMLAEGEIPAINADGCVCRQQHMCQQCRKQQMGLLPVKARAEPKARARERQSLMQSQVSGIGLLVCCSRPTTPTFYRTARVLA